MYLKLKLFLNLNTRKPYKKLYTKHQLILFLCNLNSYYLPSLRLVIANTYNDKAFKKTRPR